MSSLHLPSRLLDGPTTPSQLHRALALPPGRQFELIGVQMFRVVVVEAPEGVPDLEPGAVGRWGQAVDQVGPDTTSMGTARGLPRNGQGWLTRGQWGGSPNWQSHGRRVWVVDQHSRAPLRWAPGLQVGHDSRPIPIPLGRHDSFRDPTVSDCWKCGHEGQLKTTGSILQILDVDYIG